MTDGQQTINSTMTIRRMDLAEADRDAVIELAERDSRQPLDGPVLGVEIEGILLAAISLADGSVVSDPFSRTAELRAILELRATQLRRRRSDRRGLRTPHRRPRPAIGGSPAGSILSLPRWG